MSTIVVHHLERSRSHRILWLLEELGVDYTMRTYPRDPKTMRAPPELRSLHPLGKAPIVEVDGLILAESGAIVEHLVDAFGEGRLRPEPGTPEHRRYRYWLHYAEGSLTTPLLVKLITTQIAKAKVPFFVRPVARGIAAKVDANFTTPELTRHFAFLEQELADRPWFAGESFTAADIQLSYPIDVGVARAGLDAPLPNVHGWLERIRARPAHVAATARGGPNDPL